MFSNMEQTRKSPIYGIANWFKCADICQSRLQCQYWQWDEENEACYTITRFAGFFSKDGFVSGARNCPVSSSALPILCPSKGSSSLMWRDTNEANNDFLLQIVA